MSSRVFVVAEIGSVHDGSFGNARKLIEVAAECGADAVKFQTHIAAAETLRSAPSPAHFTDEPRFEYFERTAFSGEQWRALSDACRNAGIEFMSSAFSIEAVELLDDLGVKRHKVASGEVTNVPLLEAIARSAKPVLLSSGMSSWAELDQAVETLRVGGSVTVLQCTSLYPCPPEHVGLNVMVQMKERYRLPIGLSDHTLDNHAALAAVALGAIVIEKHLTFSRQMYGSDARFASEPGQFAEMVAGIRAIERMLGEDVDKDDLRDMGETREAFQKSLVSLVDISAGTTLTDDMIGIKKPGTGIPPSRYRDVVGAEAKRDIAADSLLTEADLVWKPAEQRRAT